MNSSKTSFWKYSLTSTKCRRHLKLHIWFVWVVHLLKFLPKLFAEWRASWHSDRAQYFLHLYLSLGLLNLCFFFREKCWNWKYLFIPILYDIRINLIDGDFYLKVENWNIKIDDRKEDKMQWIKMIIEEKTINWRTKREKKESQKTSKNIAFF